MTTEQKLSVNDAWNLLAAREDAIKDGSGQWQDFPAIVEKLGAGLGFTTEEAVDIAASLAEKYNRARAAGASAESAFVTAVNFAFMLGIVFERGGTL